jgi:hypothetical protein
MSVFQRVRIRGPRFRSFRLSKSWLHHGGCSVLLSESALHVLTMWLQGGLLWALVGQECEDQNSALLDLTDVGETRRGHSLVARKRV